jgi:hypothetical protein
VPAPAKAASERDLAGPLHLELAAAVNAVASILWNCGPAKLL